MKSLGVAIAIVCTLLLAVTTKADTVALDAAQIEAAMKAYFAHPNDKNEKVLEKLIPANEVGAITSPADNLRVSDYIEANTELLEKQLLRKKSHAVRVAMLLLCFYYDHHVRNTIALDLGALLISDPALILREAEAIAMSPKILAAALACEGVCGPDGDAIQQLNARAASVKKYCASHDSMYCAACIEAIESTAKEVIEQEKEAS